jgi:hypothetical protein
MDETLVKQGKNRWRAGMLLIPRVLIWLVLVLTLRRDLNYDVASTVRAVHVSTHG